MKRVLILSSAAVLALSLLCALPGSNSSQVLAANVPAVTLDIQNAAPRQVEDATEKAVARDYANAWKTMTEALDQNRGDLLGANFSGTSNDKLTETIKQQKKAGLHRRYVVRPGFP